MKTYLNNPFLTLLTLTLFAWLSVEALRQQSTTGSFDTAGSFDAQGYEELIRSVQEPQAKRQMTPQEQSAAMVYLYGTK